MTYGGAVAKLRNHSNLGHAWVTAAVLKIALLSIACSPSVAAATSYGPLLRPLTPRESAEYAASGADAVVVGRIQGVSDTLVSGLLTRFIEFQPSLWLKGAWNSKQFRIAIPDYNEDGMAVLASIARGTHREAICFLIRGPTYWELWASPFFYGRGIVDLETGSAAGDVALVKAAIADCSPEGLARRVDALVVGDVVSMKESCDFAGKRVRCSTVAIESVAVGEVREQRINVIAPQGSLCCDGSVVLCLRRIGPGLYEQIGFSAGALEIRDGLVGRRRDREPVGVYLARFRALRSRN